jgi:hypothetical protein
MCTVGRQEDIRDASAGATTGKRCPMPRQRHGNYILLVRHRLEPFADWFRARRAAAEDSNVRAGADRRDGNRGSEHETGF